MKILKKIFIVVASAFCLTGCDDGVLEKELVSRSEETPKVSVNIIEDAKAGLKEAYLLMYSGLYDDKYPNSRNFCGEPWIQTFYGDSGSPDFWDTYLWGYQSEFQFWNLMIREGNFLGKYNGWMYSYTLIDYVNGVIKLIVPELENSSNNEKNELKFLLACCYTLRAHAYTRLMQIYGCRFEDSNGGNNECYPLKPIENPDNKNYSSYKECVQEIYNDLDEAIGLYQSSGMKRQFGYEPDINVARGIYSRIALLNHDWQRAAEMAKVARADYPIMSAEEYKAGFCDPNGEWLWYNDPDPSNVGYVSWGAAYSCNGIYAISYNWSGAGCISLRIYDEIFERSNNDVRCELFWTPDKFNKYANLEISEREFWNPSVVNEEYFFMYGPGTNEKVSASIALFAKMMNPNSSKFTQNAFGCDMDITPEKAESAVGRRTWFKSLPTTTVNTCQPGAQVKFWSLPEDQYNASSHPFMRGAELLLTQAEAEYELGNFAMALQLLVELNSKRIPNYSCSLTGEALRDEIRLYRRMELWGEGDCWFSLKRWNVPVKRSSWWPYDISSDTFPYIYAGKWGPEWANGWRFDVPSIDDSGVKQVYAD